MAKFYTYKNGITGLRYKEHYIVPAEADGKLCRILDSAGEPVSDFRDTLQECQWFLDKLTADTEIRASLEKLYRKEIYEINGMYFEMLRIKNERRFTKEEKLKFQLIETVRSRRVDGKPF